MNPYSKKSLSLIVAVYNAPLYLEYILLSLQRQTMKDFEVVIADDGSNDEIAQVIDRARKESQFPIQHLWQEDKGFRKNVMLNEAIRKAQTDFLVFIDGDCLPHRHFLTDHWNNRRENAIHCGRRVNFSKPITEKLTTDEILSGKYEQFSFRLLLDGLMARSSNLEDGIRIPNAVIRNIMPRNKPRILGCNFSVEKKLLEKINGFNEDYQAPGIGEDTDIAYRFELLGARFISLRYMAILYHLYHPATIADERNKKVFDDVVRRKEIKCLNGLLKLS